MNYRFSIAHGLLLVVLLQTLALAWMVIDRSLILKQGAEVLLKVRPVDPRDLFRGDFVILDYEISWLGPDIIGQDHEYLKYDMIYVALKKQPDGLWKAVSAHPSYIQEDDQTVIIKGRVRSTKIPWRQPVGSQQRVPCPKPCNGIRVAYGIENYFVPEGEGRMLEKLRNQSRMDILAAVGSSGNGAIKALIVDGKSTYVEPLL